MSDNDQNNPSPKKKSELEEIERQEQEIRRMLSSIQGDGYTATLWRVAPKWAESFLEELELDPAVGIDLGYICQTWGGERIHIKIRDSKGSFRGATTLNFKSWKPRVLGKTINRYDDFGEIDISHGNMPGNPGKKHRVNTANQQLVAPQQHVDPNLMVKEMFGMFRDFTESFQQQQQDREDRRNQNREPNRDIDGVSSVDSLKTMIDNVHALQELKKVLGKGEQLIDAKSEDDSSGPFAGVIAQVAQMLFQQKTAPVVVPPVVQPPPPQLGGVRNDIPPAKPPTNVPSPRPQPPAAPDLAGVLAAMPPENIGDLLMAAASRMTPEQRNAAAEVVGTRLNSFEAIEYLDEDEIEEEEEDSFIDENQPTNPTPDSDPNQG